MKFPKKKPFRLEGKRLHVLYRAVYERDQECCVRCGEWIWPGIPPHHIKFRSQGGEDKMENLETLCHKHHYEIHYGGKRGVKNA